MALKDTWTNLVDGESEIVSEDINEVAQAVIELEKKNDELKIPTVVQEMGESETAVMSQKAVTENIRQVSEDISYNLETSSIVTEIDFEGGVEGKYINFAGSLFTSESFSLTNPFKVRKNSKLVVTCAGYLSNVAIISSYEDGVYTPLVISRGNDIETYEYKTEKDVNIVVSYRNLNEHRGKIFLILEDTFKRIENDLNGLYSFYDVVNDFSDESTYFKGEYVKRNGAIGKQEGWCRTKPFVLDKNCTLIVTGRGSGTNVAIISKYNRESETYTPIIISTDSEVKEYTYTADEGCEIVVSVSLESEHYYTYQKLGPVKKIDNLEAEIKEIEATISIDFTKILKRMAGIGDSLMSGQTYDSASNMHANCYNSSWLAFLSKYNNAKWECFSAGGLTTKSWIEGRWKTDFEALTEIPDTVFVALGTNDKNSQEEIPTGTATDSVDDTTFCGRYKKIIEIIHAKCPHAVIFCCSLYGNTDSLEVEYSELIKNISSQYTYCNFVDIANNLKINRQTNNVYAESSHFSTVGYMVVADTIHSILKRDMENNLNKYKYFGLYNP